MVFQKPQEAAGEAGVAKEAVAEEGVGEVEAKVEVEEARAGEARVVVLDTIQVEEEAEEATAGGLVAVGSRSHTSYGARFLQQG
ncbi:hypothetical protein B566_EDAN012750 [Ephemera danica]|nr:hypothetical protein B566_EDAN012750 [Ephemera danica]